MNNKSQFSIVLMSIKDLISSPMLKIAFIPFFITLIVLYFTFFSIADMGLDALQNTTLQIQTQESLIQNGTLNSESTTQTYTGYWILDFLLKYSITSWIVSFLIYTIGSFAVLWVSLFISLIIVGFLTSYIIAYIQHKYYPNIKIEGYGTALTNIYFLLKNILIMLLLFIVLIPFYFIPLINIIAINLPFYYFFHKMLHFDVGSTLLSKEKHLELQKNNTFVFRMQTLFLYFLSMIPFLALILPVFYIIYLGHNYMGKITMSNKAFKPIETLT